MRKTIHNQLSFVEPKIEHEHAEEFSQIQKIIEANPEIAAYIHQDLIAGLKNPETGREGELSGEQVFKIILVKQIHGFSYRSLEFHLKDSRTYRAFCGFGLGDKVPSFKTIQRDIKKIRPESFEAINQTLLAFAAKQGIEKGRTVRVDCTVVESNIHEPSDSSLLLDSVRVLSRVNKRAQERFGLPAFDRSRMAKKRFKKILNSKNKADRVAPYKDLLKVTRELYDNATNIAEALQKQHANNPDAIALVRELNEFLPLVARVIFQAHARVIEGKKLPASEKIFSIFEPHTDIIIKDRRDVFYGHKIALSSGKSGLFLDLVIESGNPADSTLAVEMVERQHEIYGRYPRQSAMDGGFASGENLEKIKELSVKDVVFAKKRGLKVNDMAKSSWVYKTLRNFRAGIEGMISFLKRCFGMRRCTWSGFQSFKAYSWASLISANLTLLARRMMV